MVQSFDPANVTLADAADLVAVRAQLGVAVGFEKQSFDMAGIREGANNMLGQAKGGINGLINNFDFSNPAHAAMLGGGVGLGVGGIGTLLSRKKKKNYLRNMLLGALLGGGSGLAASLVSSNAKGLMNNQNPVADAVGEYNTATARHREIAAGSPERFEGEGDALIQQIDTLKGKIGDIDPSVVQQYNPQFKARRQAFARSESLTDAGGQLAGHALEDVVNDPAAGLGIPAAGYAAGKGVDALQREARIRGGSSPTASNLRGLDADAMKRIFGDQGQAYGTGNASPKYKMDPLNPSQYDPAGGPRFKIKIPFTQRSFEFGGTKPVRTPANQPFSNQPAMSPGQMSKATQEIRAQRRAKIKPSKSGGRAGAGLGILTSIFRPWAGNSPAMDADKADRGETR